MRIISGADIRALVNTADLVKPMGEALASFSTGGIQQQPRVTVAPEQLDGRVLIMPSSSPAAGVGLKVLSMFERSTERALPSVQGLVILLDPDFGEPLALLDGTALTELRTAAVTARATDALARADAVRMAVIGAGVQARAHLEGLAGVREWTRIRVVGRNRERAEALVAHGRDLGLPAELAENAAQACRDADVVCTATSSWTPVLEDADVATEGVHINAIGAFGPDCRELPTALVARGEVFVDSREGALAEAGDLLIPIAEGAVTAAHIRAEIGEVLAGTAPGRVEEGATTIFETLGLAVQDLVTARIVYDRAVAAGLGATVEL
jgi:ornithine cyclodeaminase